MAPINLESGYIQADSIDTGALTRAIETGFRFLESNIDHNGIQYKFMGPSRSELNLCNSQPKTTFPSMLAVDLLGDFATEQLKNALWSGIGNLPTSEKLAITYFYEKGYNLPNDIDSTSLRYTISLNILEHKYLQPLRSKILGNVCSDGSGILQTYFGPRGHRIDRIDPCVNANALRLLYCLGVDEEALTTEDYIFVHLVSKKYLNGTRYYHSPDTFLYFVTRAVACNKRAYIRFREHIYANLCERVGSTTYPVDSAQRILAFYYLNYAPKHANYKENLMVELANVLSQQDENGGWAKDSLYATGGHPVTHIGGKELSTVFAIAAVRACQKLLT